MNNRKTFWLRYGAAVALVAAAALVRLDFLQILGNRNIFLTFFPAVILAALYGGFTAGLLAALLSAALADFFLVEPVHSFLIRDTADIAGFGIFLFSSVIICWLAEAMHRAQSRARKAEVQASVEAAQRHETETKALLGAIVESTDDAIISKDLNGIIQSWNMAAARMFGYTADEIVGKPMSLLIPKERLNEEEEILKRIKGGERISNYDTVRVGKDGHLFDVSVTVSPLRNGAGEIVGASKIIRDVTRRKHADEALRLSEEKFAAAFTRNPAAIAITRLEDGTFLEVNDTWQEMEGYARDEVIGRSARQLPVWPTQDAANRYVTELKEKGFLQGWEQELLRKSGELYVVQMSAQVLTVAGEKVILTTMVDITKRKRAEDALRESQDQSEFLAALIRTSSQPLGVGYPDGRLGLVNRAFEELTGYTTDELCSIDRAKALTPPEWRDIETENLFLLQRTGRPVRYEKEYVRKDGRRIPVELLVHLAKDPNGKPQYYYSFITDITERKTKEEELRRLNRTLRALSESNKAMIHARDESQYLKDVCQIIVNTCGHALVWIGFAENDEHKSVRPAAHSGFEDGYLGTLQITWGETERGRGPTGTAIRTGKPCMCKNMQTEGSFAPWREEALKRGYASSLSLPLLSEGKAFGAVTIYSKQPDSFYTDEISLLADLTAEMARGITSLRLHSQHTRDEQQLRLQLTVLQSAANAIVITGRDGAIEWVNPAFTKLTGYSTAEAIGKNPRVLKSGMHDKAFYKEMWTTILNGRVWHGEVVNKRKDGSLYTEEMTITPFSNQEGAITHFVAIKQDVTSRKQAEEALKKSSDELAGSNLELQQFAYVASHDLQEPLRAVAGYLSLVEERYRDKVDEQGRLHIAGAIQGAERMHALINDLLELSRVGTRANLIKPADMNIVLKTALDNLSHRINTSGAKVTHDALPMLNVDSNQMVLLFQNLISNAIKFQSDQPPQIHISAKSNAGQWEFSVRDNGIGIEPKHYERIFQIFQRLHTRKEYPGTGIGLAICKKIVERHGGRIWVESMPGKGSTFYFTIPDKEA